ncbi:hypothetical protein BUALT_Bualt11G0108200 [Buddleja alternifolia]|uniref:HMA domain-containing protein n=1 Tax=Buddleja alternifolia TaxID=168488 RepID=A0AAV6WV49_9LAMI|nr:hypothetical protein BUALT_Bualt11G0108200 [Buddleja alternifolia]
MGEKAETTKEVEKKSAAGGENKAADGGGKKDEAPITVVLKLDLHCEGCAKKVRRSVTHLEGVEKVKADCNAKKLMVTGNVNPTWLREKVESKTKKKVELVSPPPKKDSGVTAGGGDKKADEKSAKKEEEKKLDEVKKPKEAEVSTVVMKIRLHCDGCANKIKRVILKHVDVRYSIDSHIKWVFLHDVLGVSTVTTNLQKDLVTVMGTMNSKELATYLKEKLQRSVEIVPPKKTDDNGDKKEKEGGGEKKEKEGGGGGGGGGEKKGEKSDGGSGGDKKESESKALSSSGEGTKVEVNKMEYHSTYNPQTHYATPMYNQAYDNQGYGAPMNHDQGYYNTGHVVQYKQGPPLPPPTYVNMNDHMFSDENPNGCSVM